MIVSRRERDLLLERSSIADKVQRMPSFCTIEHGQPHFHWRPRAIVRGVLVTLLILGACVDVIGAMYVRQQHVALNRRVQDVAIRFTRPPPESPLAKLD